MKSTKLLANLALAVLLMGGCVQKRTEVNYPKDIKQPTLSQYELNVIAEKIYQNETSGNPEHLMFWSTNESFASLGIGHFIWYPAGSVQRFEQTFPAMIDYYIAKKIEIPSWLYSARKTGAPWKNRAIFEAARGDNEFQQLKNLLMNTKALQTQFFFDRLHASIPEIASNVAPQYRKHIVDNYNALAATKGGLYPLIDYINFKGKGLKSTERYNNQGWGLLQVLKNMRAVEAGPAALMEFSRTAQLMLERRVRNSPPANNESRWLPGWKVRTNGYATSIL